MEQVLVKAGFVLFFIAFWLNMGGIALFTPERVLEEPWTVGGVVYLSVITIFCGVMIYFGLTVHWYRAW
jgi:hypothetical protein